MPSPTEPTPLTRGWQALLAAAVLVAGVIAVVVAHRAESSTDFRDFWENARHFRQTGQIAFDLGVHNYLPFFTILMTPWSLVPLPAAAVAFVLLSLTLFGLTATLVERLLVEGPQAGPRPALLAALAFALPYVYACAVVGNLGLMLVFLVVATWFLAERGRDWPAGLALGLATVIKLLPGVLILFFLLQRRWRIAGGALLVTLALGIGLPVAALGPRQAWLDHCEFYRKAVEGHSALNTILADHPRKAQFNNIAVPIVLRRLLSPVDGGTESTGRVLVNVVDWPRPRIAAIYFVLMGGVLLASVLVSVRRRRWPPPGRDHPASGVSELDAPVTTLLSEAESIRARRAQFGLWCCVMLLSSPLVWTHYLPLAYWPLAILADRVAAAGTARWCRFLGGVALVMWLVGAILLALPAARAAGAPIVAVAVLWLALLPLSLAGKWSRRSPRSEPRQ